MTAAYFEDHPTDPDKVILRKPHMKVEGPLHVVCQCDECKNAWDAVAWGVFDGQNLHDMFFTKEEAQEMVRLKGDGSVVKPLYTTQRPWIGLTDEEIWETPTLSEFARAIEAKLKEKNHG